MAGWFDAAPWSDTSDLTSAGARNEPAVQRRADELANALADELHRVGPGVAVLLELEPALGVRVAARINARRLAHVVLVLPRWPYAEAVLPTQALLDALLAEAARLALDMDAPRDAHCESVVFVTDSERAQSVRRPITDRRADNRYRLGPADLPSLRDLLAVGVRRIVKVSAR